jgi:large subunit ribosomal protein L10
MKSKTQKKKELEILEASLSKSKITVFTSFAGKTGKGLGVADMQKLKKDLRGVNSEYIVEKKTLLNKALTEKKMKADVFEFPGSIGVVFGSGDETAVAKSVYSFSRKNPAFKYFGAFVGDKFMDFAEFTEYAKLPSREVLLARFLGMLMYPLTSFAGVLNQIAKKNESAGVAN